MKCVPFEGQTSVLGAPRDWDERKHGPCDGLPVKHEPGAGFISTWEFTAEEIATLYSGGKVKLRVYSASHPPIALWVEDK